MGFLKAVRPFKKGLVVFLFSPQPHPTPNRNHRQKTNIKGGRSHPASPLNQHGGHERRGPAKKTIGNIKSQSHA